MNTVEFEVEVKKRMTLIRALAQSTYEGLGDANDDIAMRVKDAIGDAECMLSLTQQVVERRGMDHADHMLKCSDRVIGRVRRTLAEIAQDLHRAALPVQQQSVTLSEAVIVLRKVHSENKLKVESDVIESVCHQLGQLLWAQKRRHPGHVVEVESGFFTALAYFTQQHLRAQPDIIASVRDSMMALMKADRETEMRD